MSWVGVLLLSSLVARPQDPTVALVRCHPRSSAPCASVRLDPAAAKPLIGLDSAVTANGWRARFMGANELTGIGRPSSDPRSRYRVLVLLDVSGSMKGSKIGVARLVLRQFLGALDSLPPASVRVAVAPFGSVDVGSRIRDAVFTAPDSAGRAIDLLPAPSRENTALYSAAQLGAERLAAEVARAGSRAIGLLVILTDGDNDVGGSDDDPDLLTGPGGLSTAAQAVTKSGVWSGIIAIGHLTQESLESLAGRRGFVFPLAPTPGAYELAEPLVELRRLVLSRWDVAIRLGVLSRAELGRGYGRLDLTLAAPDGRRVQLGSAIWRPPFVALPAFDQTSVEWPERSAPNTGTGAGLVGILLPIFFLVLVLLELWVVLPRLLWSRAGAGEPSPAAVEVAIPVAGAARPSAPVASQGPVAIRFGPARPADPVGLARNPEPFVPGAASAPTVVPLGSPPQLAEHREAPPRTPSEITASKARRA
jgi:hypothetical protein